MPRAVSGAENAEQVGQEVQQETAGSLPRLSGTAGAEGLPFSLSQDTGCAACSASGMQCEALLLLTVCLVTFQPIILGCLCV